MTFKYARHDHLIDELLASPDYRITEEGKVWRLNKRLGVWNLSGESSREGEYIKIRFGGVKLAVHRIVYRKFHGPLEPSLYINHKDGNPSNNHPANLEMVTVGENNAHGYRVLGNPAIKGAARITQDIANSIREDRKSGLTYKALMEQYGLCKSSISCIVNGRTWSLGDEQNSKAGAKAKPPAESEND